MHRLVYLDFETRSTVDIKKCGSAIYAESPDTEVLCLCYAVNNEHVRLVVGEHLHSAYNPELRDLALDPNTIFVAHNATFEQDIWRAIMVARLGYAPIPIQRWKCTQAKAYSFGLPGNLEEIGKVLDLPIQKDMQGHKAMLKLCRPRASKTLPYPTFWTPETAPTEFAQLYNYCAGDVVVERLIDCKLLDLAPDERRIWEIDQRMNQEGVHLDLATIEKAIELTRIHKDVCERKFTAISEQNFGLTQRDRMLDWIRGAGIKLDNMQKGTIAKLLKQSIPQYIRDALGLRQEATKTSLAKLPKMIMMSRKVQVRNKVYGWIRNQLKYHAAHTGRWGGQGAQFHNIRRATAMSLSIVGLISVLNYEEFSSYFADVSETISKTIRSMLVAPEGEIFYGGDQSQMESRIVAWLAGQQEVLDVYIAGGDLYCQAASDIYGYAVDNALHKLERQTGKVAVLALGYGGGIQAFANMCDIYELDLLAVYPQIWMSSTLEERANAERAYILYCKRTAEKDRVAREVAFVADVIKQRWRIANDKIEEYWHVTEGAAIDAVQTNKPVHVGICRHGAPGIVKPGTGGPSEVVWFVHNDFLHCKLPSGRCLSYPRPRINVTNKGKRTLSYRSARYGRITVWGGVLVENLTQAVQRDLLRDAIIRLEDEFPVCLHVHDEVISRLPIDRATPETFDRFAKLLGATEQWAATIPVDVKCWQGTRYGKE